LREKKSYLSEQQPKTDMKVSSIINFALIDASVVHYRYKDVISLAQRYWEKNGEKFDPTKYLAYGLVIH
jgi:hypothetical protein